MFKRTVLHGAAAAAVGLAAIGCGGGEPAIEDEAAPVTPIPSETTIDDAIGPPPGAATDAPPALTPPESTVGEPEPPPPLEPDSPEPE